jgi:hypothetical protein
MPSKTPKQKSFMAAVANNPKFAKKVGVSQQVGKEFEMKDKKKPVKKLAFGGLGGAQMNSAPARNPLAGAQMNSAPARNPLAPSTLGGASAPIPASASNPFAGRTPEQKRAAVGDINQAPAPAPAPVRPDRTAAVDVNQSTNQYFADLGRRVKDGSMTADQARAAQVQFRNQVQKSRAPVTGQAAESAARNITRGVMQPASGGFAKGGKVKQADGIAKKGKTATKMVKMAKGGSVSTRADGIATRGKTNCKMPGMAKGGMMKKGCK